jgi:predicted nucleic acid-binding protein
MVLPEFANALWAGARSGAMPAAVARRAVPELIASDWLALVASAPLVADALAMGIELDHPVYDLIYVALARREGTRLVTADARLLASVSGTPYESLVQPLT